MSRRIGHLRCLLVWRPVHLLWRRKSAILVGMVWLKRLHRRRCALLLDCLRDWRKLLCIILVSIDVIFRR